MINTAFTNYLDMFPSLTESLQCPFIKNRTTYEQTLPINLIITGFDKTLLHAPTNLKDFVTSEACVPRKKLILFKRN